MTPIGSIAKIGGIIKTNMDNQIMIAIHMSFFDGKYISTPSLHYQLYVLSE